MAPLMSTHYESPRLNLLGMVAELTANSSSKTGPIYDGLSTNTPTPGSYSCESGNSTTCSSNH